MDDWLKPFQEAYRALCPAFQEVKAQLLRFYWQLLWKDSAFCQAWSTFCTRLEAGEQGVIETFCAEWKLPAPFQRAIRIAVWKGTIQALREGQVEPHLVRMSVNLVIPPPTLEVWRPTQEGATEYERRVRKQVKAYQRKVREVYRKRGFPIDPQELARWRSPEYLEEVAWQLYLRVVKGLNDSEVFKWLYDERKISKEVETIRKETTAWLKRLEFPPSTLHRKRGRPRKCKSNSQMGGFDSP